ncbi:transglutaminase family protein [Bacillus sp. FJAT-45037]|uniref:transglutaminase family protein n=1 Tax=Bacillus sp. FJAT-45037 TaxID=2011007 RepID=UPI001E381619|nr:transglutaminase domain-containing protein [Bacillus sp. FJAT-45037]
MYGLSFILLLEWLWPVPYVTDTGFLHVFVMMTAAFFIITFLQLRVYFSLPLKVVAIIFGLFYVFVEGPLLSMEWVSWLLADFLTNIGFVMSGQWDAMTDVFRSFLFFALLAIMSYLLFYWTVYARRILFFLVFTVIYITVIDTFTVYDATYAIIRIFIIGCLLLGFVTLYRMIEKDRWNNVPAWLPVRIASLLLVLIAVAGAIGFLAPKPEPQWSDPIPYVKAALGIDDPSGQGGGEGVQRIGYGDNDEELGGGFVDDQTPLFYAAVEEGRYWRGETKDFYTGRGWEVTTPPTPAGEMSIDDLQSGGATFTLGRTEVAFADEASRNYPHLFYPGTLLSETVNEETEIIRDLFTERADTFRNEGSIELVNYSIEYANPTFDIEGLRSADEEESMEIVDYYTQLPGDLPDRVHELAAQLTEDQETRYDQVRAIEAYFQSPEFTYETQDVPVPQEDEDYVDQFLFETQRGYCDNFSTSMVVLLRSNDIPARWVKGFTEGEPVDTLEDDRDVYQVTNGNAHSWVEVHFPGVGWVPFEPTRGFDATYEFVETEEEGSEEEDATEEGEEEDTEVEDAFAHLEDSGSESTSGSSDESNSSFSITNFLFLISLVGLALLGVKGRKRIVGWFTLLYFSKKAETEATFLEAYVKLMWFIGFIGYKRQNGETLREYAIRIDLLLGGTDMMTMTEEYERIYYGKKASNESWGIYRKNWIRVVKQINS